MKATTVHSLITARTLYDEAAKLIESGDRHMCSAGLILLQDALEILFLAMLVEKDVDEQKALESKSFDELLGELKKVGVKVPKTGTLKAMNKQRVITKHYGQLAEPATVQTYAEASDAAIESIVPQVLGKRMREIFLTDLLDEGEARDFLTEAASLIDKKKFLRALVAVRQALYVEIEYEYAVNGWKDISKDESQGLIAAMAHGGRKAPYWTRNKEWIAANVKEPIDYVQVDHERLRLDAMEWGVNTAELENLRRLTPVVFRAEKGETWRVQFDYNFPPNEATLSNVRYCLDRAVSILLRKQQHSRARRWPQSTFNLVLPSKSYIGSPVYERASADSKVVHTIAEGWEYSRRNVLSGFSPNELYYSLYCFKPGEIASLPAQFVAGFLRKLEDEEPWPPAPRAVMAADKSDSNE